MPLGFIVGNQGISLLFVECCLLYNLEHPRFAKSQGGVISQRDKKYIISFGNDLLSLVKGKGGVISLT